MTGQDPAVSAPPARPAGGGSFLAVRPVIPLGLGRVELVGRITGGRGIRPRALRHYPNHAVMIVTGGLGSYRGPGGRVVLRPGSLVVVRPDEPHWYGPAIDDSWDESFCAARGPLFDLAARRGVIAGPGRVFAVPEPGPLIAHLERLRRAPPPTTTGEQDAEAVELLAVLTRTLAPKATPDRSGGWLATSMRLLAAEGCDDDLAHIAAMVEVPYETWRRRFRDQVGVAPGRYRLLARLRAAASLLSMTSLPITEVAHRTGFVDDRHLARHFVHWYGVTPGRYRRAPGAAPGAKRAGVGRGRRRQGGMR